MGFIPFVLTGSDITLPVTIAEGGTGQITQQAAIDALAGAVTAGQVLRGNGTHILVAAIQAGDVPTLNQNTTGTASNVTGTVARANGGTGVTTTPAAPFTSKPAAPNNTTSASLVMMGLGATWTLTPASSGKVQLIVTGTVTTATGVATAGYAARYGTGTAPNNGDAVTGTNWGGAASSTSLRPAATSTPVPFSFNDVVSLTPSTAYWFDLALDTGNASDAASYANLSFTAIELS